MGSLSPNRGGGEVLGGGGQRAREGSLSLSGVSPPCWLEGLRRSPQRRHVERSGGPSLGGGHQRHLQRCGSGHWQVFLGPGCLFNVSRLCRCANPIRTRPAGSGGPIRWPGSCRADRRRARPVAKDAVGLVQNGRAGRSRGVREPDPVPFWRGAHRRDDGERVQLDAPCFRGGDRHVHGQGEFPVANNPRPVLLPRWGSADEARGGPKGGRIRPRGECPSTRRALPHNRLTDLARPPPPRRSCSCWRGPSAPRSTTSSRRRL